MVSINVCLLTYLVISFECLREGVGYHNIIHSFQCDALASFQNGIIIIKDMLICKFASKEVLDLTGKNFFQYTLHCLFPVHVEHEPK